MGKVIPIKFDPIRYTPSDKQNIFHGCNCVEVLYGGAKGGGKSCALVMDSFAYGMEYAGAKIYLFRETFDDLESNLINEFKEKIPECYYIYNETKHIATLINGTRVYFRYITCLKDAQKYKGRSIDYIGVDELTKHTKEEIQELMSCLRSPFGFPAIFRATTNPGEQGHVWVKERYVTKTDYGKHIYIDEETGNSVAFIPANVYDNDVLMANDPKYVKRLEGLPENQKKAYLYGDWDIFEGQFFPEMRREIHIVKPFEIPEHWKKFRCVDYGLDMLVCLWIALDTHGNGYVYRGLSQKGLGLTAAAKLILQHSPIDEEIMYTVASPDLWKTNRETGVQEAETMIKAGLKGLKPADAKRVRGWREVREWITPYELQDGTFTARLKIFDLPELTKTRNDVSDDDYTNLFDDLAQIGHEENNFEDAADEPHKLTHMPEALRYGIMSRPPRSMTEEERKEREAKMRRQNQAVNKRAGY